MTDPRRTDITAAILDTIGFDINGGGLVGVEYVDEVDGRGLIERRIELRTSGFSPPFGAEHTINRWLVVSIAAMPTGDNGRTTEWTTELIYTGPAADD